MLYEPPRGHRLHPPHQVGSRSWCFRLGCRCRCGSARVAVRREGARPGEGPALGAAKVAAWWLPESPPTPPTSTSGTSRWSGAPSRSARRYGRCRWTFARAGQLAPTRGQPADQAAGSVLGMDGVPARCARLAGRQHRRSTNTELADGCGSRGPGRPSPPARARSVRRSRSCRPARFAPPATHRPDGPGHAARSSAHRPAAQVVVRSRRPRSYSSPRAATAALDDPGVVGPRTAAVVMVESGWAFVGWAANWVRLAAARIS